MHMAQLMPLPLAVSCFSKIQIGFTFLVPADPGSPGQRAIKRVCVCVYTVHIQTLLIDQQRFMELRDQVRWLTLVTSVLIITYSSVGASISGLTDLKTTLTRQIGVLTRNVPLECVLIVMVFIFIFW